jgi:CRISPR-associated protein Cst2
MSNIVIGLVLVDAPYSALNNAGSDAGDRTDNIIRVKSIRKGNKQYPYVSGQAWRYWWRNILEEKFNWEMSPIMRDKKIAFTEANPIKYPDDDVFGYMRALKKKDGGTVTRISPLKNSPLVSVVGQYPTNDFGVMARHEGDPVPYEHEFYSTILKGIFSLDLNNVGKFFANEKTGFKNMYPDLENFAKEQGLKQEDTCWILDENTRIERSSNVISSLPYIYGGAKLTSHLTDVTPKFMILAAINGGNHIFMNVVHEENDRINVDFDALDEVLSDYKDILLTDVYIGIRSGFLNEIRDDLNKFDNDHDNVKIGTINDVINEFNKNIPELIKE